MLNFIKYTFWPIVKVKMIYWWWIIKYGGKKNIPPDLIFRQMAKSMERMRDNLDKAFAIGKDDMSKNEFLEFNDLMKKAEGLEKKINDLKK